MKFFSWSFLIFTLLLGSSLFFVEDAGATDFPTYEEGLGATKFNAKGTEITANGVIYKVVKFVLSFLAALAVVIIIINGFIYITSGGDEARVGVARTWLVYAIVGLIIVLLAWVVVRTISTLTGMS